MCWTLDAVLSRKKQTSTPQLSRTLGSATLNVTNKPVSDEKLTTETEDPYRPKWSLGSIFQSLRSLGSHGVTVIELLEWMVFFLHIQSRVIWLYGLTPSDPLDFTEASPTVPFLAATMHSPFNAIDASMQRNTRIISTSQQAS